MQLRGRARESFEQNEVIEFAPGEPERTPGGRARLDTIDLHYPLDRFSGGRQLRSAVCRPKSAWRVRVGGERTVSLARQHDVGT